MLCLLEVGAKVRAANYLKGVVLTHTCSYRADKGCSPFHPCLTTLHACTSLLMSDNSFRFRHAFRCDQALTKDVVSAWLAEGCLSGHERKLPLWVCSHIPLGHGALAEAVCAGVTLQGHRGDIWCVPSDRNSPLTTWTEVIAWLGGLSWVPGPSGSSWAWPERNTVPRVTFDQSFSCLAATT